MRPFFILAATLVFSSAAQAAPNQVDELVVQPEPPPEFINCKFVMRGRFNKDGMTDCSTSRGVSKSGKNFYVFTLKDDANGYRFKMYFWGSPLERGRSEIFAVSANEDPPSSATGECFVSDEEESMNCMASDKTNTITVKTEHW